MERFPDCFVRGGSAVVVAFVSFMSIFGIAVFIVGVVIIMRPMRLLGLSRRRIEQDWGASPPDPEAMIARYKQRQQLITRNRASSLPGSTGAFGRRR
jgi:hypothetical protein